VLTTLRYSDEVVDPRSYEDLGKVEEPSREELDIALKIMENLTGDFDSTEFKDTFKERVEELVEQKMKGEVIAVEEPETEEVRELMSALRDTLAQLQKT